MLITIKRDTISKTVNVTYICNTGCWKSKRLYLRCVEGVESRNNNNNKG